MSKAIKGVSVTKSPALYGEGTRTGNAAQDNLTKQINEHLGVGYEVQTANGGRVAVRYNDGALEVYKDGAWSVITGSASSSTSVSSASKVLLSSSSSSSGGTSGIDGKDGQGLTWQGSWVAGKPYKAYDLVAYSGSSYICRANVTSIATPDIDTMSWSLVARMGDAGAAGQGLTWRGEWAADTSYYAYDLTGYSGSSYICVSDVNSVVPPETDTVDWDLIARGYDGGGGGASLSDTAPPASDGAASAGSGSAASRFDHKHANYQMLMEQTFEKLLQGTLTTGNATEVQVTRTFGSAATDNNGIGTYSAAPTTASGYIYWPPSPGSPTATFYLRTWGTHNIVLNRGSQYGSSLITVSLDGGGHGTWNQSSGGSATYTLSNVPAGVHTIVLQRPITSAMYLASVSYYALPYQGVGVAGDTVKLVYVPPWLVGCSIGIGPTNNGALYNQYTYGEAITHRLPLGSASSDYDCARDALTPAGWGVYTGTETGLIRVPITSSYPRTYPSHVIAPGQSIILSSTAATRGRLANTSNTYSIEVVAPALSGSVVKSTVAVAIGEITAVGSGSHLEVGQLVLIMISPVSSATTLISTGLMPLGASPWTNRGTDFFVLA